MSENKKVFSERILEVTLPCEVADFVEDVALALGEKKEGTHLVKPESLAPMNSQIIHLALNLLKVEMAKQAGWEKKLFIDQGREHFEPEYILTEEAEVRNCKDVENLYNFLFGEVRGFTLGGEYKPAEISQAVEAARKERHDQEHAWDQYQQETCPNYLFRETEKKQEQK